MHGVRASGTKKIVQNHLTVAFKLGMDGQPELEAMLPTTFKVAERAVRIIRGLGAIYPALADFKPNELSFNKYDITGVGLGSHKDSSRYRRTVVTITVAGESDVVIEHDGREYVLPATLGNLIAMRAPGIYDGTEYETTEDVRPPHEVRNVRELLDTPRIPRIVMMLREDSTPDVAIPGAPYWNLPRPQQSPAELSTS